jgi:hypothetical protein
MKSAYELAMERMGGTIRELTPEQKEQLAEIDRRADAKIAQAKIRTDARMKSIASPEELATLQQELAVELQGINEKRDLDKEELRQQFDNQGGRES